MSNDMQDTQNSRREFLKKGSLVTLGTIAIGASANYIINRVFHGSPPSNNRVLTCELFRFGDLLHLKYYFFNLNDKASISRGKLITHNHKCETPIYLYVELPPQHITEEFLEENIPQLRRDFKRKKSYLAGKSWLAFKVNQVDGKNAEVKLDGADLLDWNNKFTLVTFDDILFSKYNPAENWRFKPSNLADKDECKRINDLINNLISFYNAKHLNAKDRRELYNSGNDFFKTADGTGIDNIEKKDNPKIGIPLSTFEVPYKMMLSPIKDTEPGRYMFDSNDLRPLFDKRGGYISEVWHNNLKYLQITGEKNDPRFKVVNYLNANAKDNDIIDNTIVDLLPAPINRKDLHSLTLLPEKERDVISKQFEIGALGASASLHYSHPDPWGHSLVAWDQEIKYSRDNYASLTYRAIDLFTGFKVLVTVLIERTYVDKVSFMRRRYFLSFAEREKQYGFMYNKRPKGGLEERDETVSRTPFEKIIALSDGAYFKPVPLTELEDGLNEDEKIIEKNKDGVLVYAVLKEGSNDPLNPENYLVFKYIGIDKDGKEHAFTSKMSIIFPESYEIINGTFKYFDERGQSTDQKQGIVDFKYIGQLDPSNLVKGTGCDIGVHFDDKNIKKPYEFKRIEVFDTKEGRDKLEKSIAQARIIYTFPARIEQFEQVIKGSITYAKLEDLRLKKNEADNSIISATSTASTFETNNIFLFSKLNYSHDPKDRPYLKMHPLVPDMYQANVIIPQIDQIEGQSVLRQVEFAKDYMNGCIDLDKPFHENKKFLFFQLKKKQTDFFKENYRKAGGMVDPGISITHISALDNGITFSDLHNRIAEQSQLANKGETVSSAANISSISIFGEADAQILGIPLRDIIDVVLTEADIPVFQFKQDLEDALNQFEKLKQEIVDTASPLRELQTLYDNAKQDYENAKAKYEEVVEQVEQLRKMNIYEWVETLVQQKELIYASEFHKQAFDNFFKLETVALIAECTKTLKIKEENLAKLFEEFRDRIVNNALADAESKAAEILNNFEGYSEEVVAVLIVELLKQNETLKKELKGEKIPSPFLTAWKEVSKQFTEDKRLYVSLRKWNNYIKTIEGFSYKVKNELNDIVVKGIASIDNALYSLPELLTNVLNNLRIINVENKKAVPAFVRILIEIETAKNTLSMFENSMRKLNYHGLEKLMFEYRSKLSQPAEIEALDGVFSNYSKKFKDEVCIAQKKLSEHFTNVNAQLNAIGAKYGVSIKSIIDKFITYTLAYIDKSENFALLPEFDLTQYREVLKAFEAFEKDATEFKGKIEKEYRDAIVNASGLQQQFKDAEKRYKSFVTDALKQLKDEINREEQKLRDAFSDVEAYQKALDKFNQLKMIYARLTQPVNMELNYHYSYNNFRRASFAGVIDFIPNKKNTQLTVDVSYATKFQLTDFNPSGLKVTNSYHTKSSLTDFKIGLAQIIFVDFESVSFTTGSDLKDDFMVKIRSVDFGGIMAFVDAFKEYLKSIDNNLVFDLNTSRAQIGYGVSLPNITAGAFNCFNLNLSALFVLPFDPKKSLQLHFGFGNELNKFGITVSGIFGGQGYFNLIAEPKRGIVGLIIVLEFGAIFNLNLGVASGTAYLVGGVYIRREKLPSGRDLIECRAYILAVGRLRIVGLFSASLTFYVGLEGDGHILKGVATVTASKRFSRFFKISVSVSYEKTLRGAKRDEIDNPNKDSLYFHTLDIVRADSNSLLPNSVSLSDLNLEVEDIRSALKLTENPNGNYTIELESKPADSEKRRTIVGIKRKEKLEPNNTTAEKEDPSKLDNYRGVFFVVVKPSETNKLSQENSNYLIPVSVVPKPKAIHKNAIDNISVEEYYESYY